MGARVLWADGIVTGDGHSVLDGAIALDDDGRVFEVGRAVEVLARHQGAPVERVRGVVMPGLVNAHVHLELSALRGTVQGGVGFVPWVERLIGMRVELLPEEDEGALSRAVAELDASGTVAVGEVTNSLAVVERLARARLAGCVFHEVFGVKRDGVMRRVHALVEDVESRVGRWSGPGASLEGSLEDGRPRVLPCYLPGSLRYSLAAHTLYTTHADAVRAILEHARVRGRRTSLHLGEHPAERRAIEHGDGPVPAWLASRVGIAETAQDWPKRALFDVAADLGALAPHVLLVHLADAREAELERVARSGAHVVLCPRSNLHIEAKLPPLLAMRTAGLSPALGTDSLASNASLDVLAEARALADRFPQVPARELLQMATWNGARALDTHDLGRIAPGARPGIFAIEGKLADSDPCAFVLKNVKAPRRWIVRR